MTVCKWLVAFGIECSDRSDKKKVLFFGTTRIRKVEPVHIEDDEIAVVSQ